MEGSYSKNEGAEILEMEEKTNSKRIKQNLTEERDKVGTSNNTYQPTPSHSLDLWTMDTGTNKQRNGTVLLGGKYNGR